MRQSVELQDSQFSVQVSQVNELWLKNVPGSHEHIESDKVEFSMQLVHVFIIEHFLQRSFEHSIQFPE